MMEAWGVAIPGLAMNASEIPKIEGLIPLQNPEVGDGYVFDKQYTLNDVAEIHLQTILNLIKSAELKGSDLWVLGMSMGGMINSVLASKFRERLPLNTRFGFLVTTPNLKTNPAIPESLLADWLTAKPGCHGDFARILKPFFSSDFGNNELEITQEYYSYRATGKNQQSPKAFFRQMAALRSFDGAEIFSKIVPEECVFIGGKEDFILGPSHNDDLKKLAPKAQHIEVEKLGHMVNLEKPQIFDFRRGNYV